MSSVSDSIIATIKKRKGIAMMAVSDIAYTVADYRADTVGGITVALEIFSLVVLPFLLNSGETWIGMNRHAEDILNEIFKDFMRRILQVPKSCPIPMMFLDLGLMLPKNLLKLKKLSFLFHLSQLKDKTLGKMIYNIQKKDRSLPSLVTECEPWLRDFNLSLEMMEKYTKEEWKKEIKAKVEEKNHKEILTMSKDYSKIDTKEVAKENPGLKDYMKSLTYKDAILLFRLRAKICETVKTQWKGTKEFEEDLYSCWHHPFQRIDQSSHIERCIHYSSLKEGLSLDRDDHLVLFYRRVIEKRKEEQKEREERREQEIK